MAVRGVQVNHATLNWWFVKYAPLIATEAHKRKRKTAVSWRMDETYVKVKGKWTHYYRAIDKIGANHAGLQNMNCLLLLNSWFRLI
jgi:putative transposase